MLTVQDIFLDRTPNCGGCHAHWVGPESAWNPTGNCPRQPHLCGPVRKASKPSSSPRVPQEVKPGANRVRGPPSRGEHCKTPASRENQSKQMCLQKGKVLGSIVLFQRFPPTAVELNLKVINTPPHQPFCLPNSFGGTQFPQSWIRRQLLHSWIRRQLLQSAPSTNVGAPS